MDLAWIVVMPTIFAAAAYKKKSIDGSGAVAGWLVAFTCCVAGFEFIMSLLFFFISSTILTRFGSKRKKKLEDGYKEGGQRNWVQVLCNGLTGSIACLAYANASVMEGYVSRAALAAAFIGHYSCCCGDTWASELGIAVPGTLSEPLLVTSLRSVPRGTNGGMSIIGTLASAVGGICVGLVLFMTSSSPPLSLWTSLCLGLAGGFGGSLIDSLLGATLQFSGWNEKLGRVVNRPGPNVRHICGLSFLDNHAVNFVSSLLTAQALSFFAEIFLSGR